MAGLLTPVLLIIFNRPYTTQLVFDVIRKARPRKLYIFADGPRLGQELDSVRVRKVREIVTHVDWDCEVNVLLQEENLGCKNGPYTAMDWFFKHEEEGIILEDDCLPDPTFFLYCQEMLNHYRDDTRVMTISGSDYRNRASQWPSDRYYFSYTCITWGWATWKRSWKCYDIEMELWPKIKKTNLLRSIYPRNIALYWGRIFDLVYDNRIKTAWDYQWIYSCLINNGLCIFPPRNLIKNIGFGIDSTHCTIGRKRLSLDVHPVSFPLKHPILSTVIWKQISRFLTVDMPNHSFLF